MFKVRIKHYRKLMRWTQKELADKSNLKQQYISDLEKEPRFKSPTLHSIESIAKALGLCPLVLLECQCDKCKKERAG